MIVLLHCDLWAPGAAELFSTRRRTINGDNGELIKVGYFHVLWLDDYGAE